MRKSSEAGPDAASRRQICNLMAIGRQRVEAGQGAFAGHDKDTDKHESQDDNKVCSSVARKLLPSFDQSENQTLPKQ